jgi:hypothetical protein
MTQKFTYQYGFPSIQPPTTIKTRVRQEVSIVRGRPPRGFRKGSTHVVEVNETDATSLQTVDSSSASYVATQGSSGLLFGSTAQIQGASGAQSTSETTIYPSPRTVYEKAGATWSNSPAATVDETYSDGHYEDRTYAANGTYAEKGTTFNSDATPAKIALEDQSSGAGSYAGPFTGCPDDTTFVFSAPAGTPPKIDLDATSSDKYCTISTIPIDAWFNANPTFYSEKDSSAAGTVPSSCGAEAGASATVVTSVRTFLDTVIGYTENTTASTYSNAGGPLCVVYTDTILNYYDWQGDSLGFVGFTPNGDSISSIVTQETLLGYYSGAAISPAVAGALESHFLAKLEPVRARLRSAMIHHLMNVKGGSR